METQKGYRTYQKISLICCIAILLAFLCSYLVYPYLSGGRWAYAIFMALIVVIAGFSDVLIRYVLQKENGEYSGFSGLLKTEKIRDKRIILLFVDFFVCVYASSQIYPSLDGSYSSYLLFTIIWFAGIVFLKLLYLLPGKRG